MPVFQKGSFGINRGIVSIGGELSEPDGLSPRCQGMANASTTGSDGWRQGVLDSASLLRGHGARR